MEKDYLIKGFICGGRARAYLLSSVDVLNEAIVRHDIYPSSASCLGKIISMGLLMGANLKGSEALTIKYNAGGPVGNLIADADAQGNIRAYLDHPHVNFVNNNGGLNELMTLGNNGFLDVIKDLKLKEMFTSSIPCTGNIANDFSAYFFQSEQTPSLCILTTKIDVDNKAIVNGGIIMQLMPGYTDKDIDYIENVANNISDVSSLFLNNNLDQIAKTLFSDFNFLEEREVRFHCECSKEKFTTALYTLSIKDLEDIKNTEEEIEMVCHYCGNKYIMTKDDIQTIINNKK